MVTDTFEHKRESLICLLESYKLEPRNVLEVCCGEGELSKRLRALYPRAEVFGLDRDIITLAKALAYGNLEEDHAIHGNALNIECPESPVNTPDKFYIIEIDDYNPNVTDFKKIHQKETVAPKDFDLVVAHDSIGYRRFEDMLTSPTGQTVPISAVGAAVKTKGHMIYSISVFVHPDEFDEKMAESSAEEMVRIAKSCGFNCRWEIIGDVELFIENPMITNERGYCGGNELNIGIFCRRK